MQKTYWHSRASNGLVANATKTTLMFLNEKKGNSIQQPISIQVGNATVTQEKNAKLLGVTMDDTQTWKSEIYGKGGLLSNLNSRQFIVKRLKNTIDNLSLKRIVDSIYSSKLRNSISLYGMIRWTEDQPTTKEFTDIQLNQNKMARYMNNTRISDQISTKSILEKHDLLSINQMNAQIKISDMWKAMNVPNYPTKIKKMTYEGQTVTTRAVTNGLLIDDSNFSNLSRKTFINDAKKAWNKVPDSIKNCSSHFIAKKLIKDFVRSLPI